MNYFKFSLTLTNFNEQSVEIITAFLFQLGFESCEESKNNIYAYASEDNVTDDLINEIEILSTNLNFKFTFNEIIMLSHQTSEMNYFDSTFLEVLLNLKSA